MAEIQKKCPKCDGDMVRGFIPDCTYGYGAAFNPKWFKGSPKSSILAGISIPSSDEIPVAAFINSEPRSSDGGIPLAAFRCSDCGFVELYADDKFKPE